MPRFVMLDTSSWFAREVIAETEEDAVDLFPANRNAEGWDDTAESIKADGFCPAPLDDEPIARQSNPAVPA